MQQNKTHRRCVVFCVVFLCADGLMEVEDVRHAWLLWDSLTGYKYRTAATNAITNVTAKIAKSSMSPSA